MKVKLSGVSATPWMSTRPLIADVVHAVGEAGKLKVRVWLSTTVTPVAALPSIVRSAGLTDVEQDAVVDHDRHGRGLEVDVAARGRVGRGHVERILAARGALDGDRVLAQVVLVGADDLDPVAARAEGRPVDDVVAAVAGVARRGGDQVAGLVVEVERRHQVVDELEAAGRGAAGRGRGEDQVVAGVDVELEPVACLAADAVAGQARGDVARGSGGQTRWRKPRVSGLYYVEAAAAGAEDHGVGDDQLAVGVGDVLLVGTPWLLSGPCLMIAPVEGSIS